MLIDLSETSIVNPALTAALLTAAGVYVLLLRPWRPRRLWRRRVPSVDALFALSLGIGLAALHAPPPFEAAARTLVAQTALPETLDAIDERIAAIEGLPEQMWADLKASLGWAAPEPASPTEADAPPAGRVGSAVMPAVLGLVEGVLRCTTYAVALLALALCQVIRGVAGLRRGATDAPAPSADLGLRVQALEASLAQLQRTLAAPIDAGPSMAKPFE